MKTQGSKFRPVVFLVVLPAAAALAGLQIGCRRDKAQEMHSAASVPASEGTVRVSEGDNGNSKVAIRVKHLAPPSKMAADSTVYVVWIQAREGDRQNVGALTLDKDLEGSLDTLTPHRRFNVSITPEPSSRTTSPSHEPVFTYEMESNK
jgi:hypothetical protein